MHQRTRILNYQRLWVARWLSAIRSMVVFYPISVSRTTCDNLQPHATIPIRLFFGLARLTEGDFVREFAFAVLGYFYCVDI